MRVPEISRISRASNGGISCASSALRRIQRSDLTVMRSSPETEVLSGVRERDRITRQDNERQEQREDNFDTLRITDNLQFALFQFSFFNLGFDLCSSSFSVQVVRCFIRNAR